MRRTTLLLLALSLAVAAGRLAAADRTAALFSGKDFAGWTFVTSPATDIATVCNVGADGVIAVAGKPVGFLATTGTHQNYRLHAEWRWPGTPGNGGVLVHIASGPKDRQWPVCFQVQTKHKAAGDLLPMAGATFADALTSAPGAATAQKAHTAADSEKPAGEWNTCDIVCRGDTIEVTVNGVLQNKVSGCSVTAGKVGFQLEGVAFELRNVRLTPLD